jgi:hypothetical protein
LGSHDTELIERIETSLGGHDDFEIAMLYGIRADEQRRYAREGYAIRTLISYGPSWYPWFMRRIAEKPVENTLLALRNLVCVGCAPRRLASRCSVRDAWPSTVARAVTRGDVRHATDHRPP